MLEAIRILEVQNAIPKTGNVPVKSSQLQNKGTHQRKSTLERPVNLLTVNRFQPLERITEDNKEIGKQFTVRKNKTINKNQPRSGKKVSSINSTNTLYKSTNPLKSSQTREVTKSAQQSSRTQNMHRPMLPKTKANLPFKTITIVGDSHARNIAGLVQESVDRGTAVIGMCKPGARVTNMLPTCTPPAKHCYIIMAGSNDVASGREDGILKHFEQVISTCRIASSVLVVKLPHRYDLASDSVVHDRVMFANHYIEELCSRLGVNTISFDAIKRSHYTTHGLHLRMSGKRLLASRIVKNLLELTKQQLVKEDPVSSPLAPISLPYDSYAAAVKQTLVTDVKRAVPEEPRDRAEKDFQRASDIQGPHPNNASKTTRYSLGLSTSTPRQQTPAEVKHVSTDPVELRNTVSQVNSINDSSIAKSFLESPLTTFKQV